MSDRPGAVAVACGSEAEADGWAVRDLVIVKRASNTSLHLSPEAVRRSRLSRTTTTSSGAHS